MADPSSNQWQSPNSWRSGSGAGGAEGTTGGRGWRSDNRSGNQGGGQRSGGRGWGRSGEESGPSQDVAVTEGRRIYVGNVQYTATAEDMENTLRENGFADVARPDLILLDLNLPRMSGHEVLAEVKNDPALRRIPVVVLTTSQAHEDIVRSYDLHASVHVSKPVDFDEFAGVVKKIDEFFGNVAQLPSD